jgi:DNA repair protein RAD16
VRLRQATSHPYLVVASATGAGAGAGSGAVAGADVASPAAAADAQVCALCRDPPEAPAAAACGHALCRACAEELLAGGAAAACPACAAPLTLALDASPSAAAPAPSTPAPRRAGRGILSRLDLARFQSSTKIEALREELARLAAADPSAKSIVFSQFTAMLDLTQFRLEQTGVRCARLAGGMTLAQRGAAIARFSDDPSCRVFLMSLQAGGVALNLTAASATFLMDSWWNPAREAQVCGACLAVFF